MARKRKTNYLPLAAFSILIALIVLAVFGHSLHTGVDSKIIVTLAAGLFILPCLA